jgi:malate/lactate dehydrogenase
MQRAIGIYGAAGGVGSAAALALAQGGDMRLVLVDADAPRLACVALDLEMLRAAVPGLDVATGGLDALASCELVVACAGVAHRDGTPRSAFFEQNRAILAPLADVLSAPATRCRAIVLVSNPVDALATWLQQRLGERVQVVGHTLNDTLRLRVAIARVRGCDPAAVEAWSVGEHGPHAVPLLSRVRVDGTPVALTAIERARVRADVGGWYERWQRLGTGRTSALSSGWGAARLVRALLDGDARPWPVSTLLHGEYGVRGICLTTPARLGPDAPPRPLTWEIDPDERAAIAVAAATTEELACASC